MSSDDSTDRESDRIHEHTLHPETADYPELLITAAPSDVALERELELADRFEDGTATLHLLTFWNPTRIFFVTFRSRSSSWPQAALSLHYL